MSVLLYNHYIVCFAVLTSINCFTAQPSLCMFCYLNIILSVLGCNHNIDQPLISNVNTVSKIGLANKLISNHAVNREDKHVQTSKPSHPSGKLRDRGSPKRNLARSTTPSDRNLLVNSDKIFKTSYFRLHPDSWTTQAALRTRSPCNYIKPEPKAVVDHTVQPLQLIGVPAGGCVLVS